MCDRDIPELALDAKLPAEAALGPGAGVVLGEAPGRAPSPTAPPSPGGIVPATGVWIETDS